jgi:hypothetical protein
MSTDARDSLNVQKCVLVRLLQDSIYLTALWSQGEECKNDVLIGIRCCESAFSNDVTNQNRALPKV